MAVITRAATDPPSSIGNSGVGRLSRRRSMGPLRLLRSRSARTRARLAGLALNQVRGFQRVVEGAMAQVGSGFLVCWANRVA